MRSRIGMLAVAVILAMITVALARSGEALPEDTGVISLLWLLLLPAPLLVGGAWGAAWLDQRDHRRVLVSAAGVATVAFVVAGIAVALPVAVYILAGLVAGWGLSRRWPWSTVIGAAAVVLAPLAVWMALENPVDELVSAEIERAREVIAEGFPGEMDSADRAAALSEQQRRLDEVVRISVALWPGCVALGLVIVAFNIVALTHAGARWLTGWSGARAIVPFVRWRLPFALVWLLVAGLVLLVTRRSGLTSVGVNGVLFAAALLAVQGIAVQAFVVGRVIGPRWQVIYWLVAGLFFAPLVVASGALLGLADQWFDIRRLGAGGDDPRTPTG